MIYSKWTEMLYANLGDDAIVHGVNETEVSDEHKSKFREND